MKEVFVGIIADSLTQRRFPRMQDWLLALLFAVIAFTYASVGFGGGSSYLALLALAAFPFQESELRLPFPYCTCVLMWPKDFLFNSI